MTRYAPDTTDHLLRRPLAELLELKQGRTVSVVIPALNEEATVATVVSSIRRLLGGLVDELVVLDSGSTDATASRARTAGATVCSAAEALPAVPCRSGKGEALWRSLLVTRGDLVVFVDADLVDPHPDIVPSLLEPLLLDPELRLVKGYYRRPLRAAGGDEGGRVTQLVARPLLAALVPSLSDLAQPLAGEYAATRELLTAIPFAPGYGVDIGILLDTWSRFGPSAIGQVDLGTRIHRNRRTRELAVMSRQVIATMFDRLGIADSGLGLVQFVPGDTGWQRVTSGVSVADRPALTQSFGPARPAHGTTGQRG
ncbi:glucosyl-3-phosphoglycerate synthase [Nocardia sp. NPDC003963]